MAGPSVMVRLLGDVAGLGKSFDETTSKGVGAGQRLHNAFSGVLDTLNKTGVLGPFGDALAAADSGIEKIAGHAKEIGPAMMGAGATVAGLGMALQAMGSKDQAAHQQLQAAVEATGHSYDQYADRAEDTIKKQEKFGTTANTTQGRAPDADAGDRRPGEGARRYGGSGRPRRSEARRPHDRVRAARESGERLGEDPQRIRDHGEGRGRSHENAVRDRRRAVGEARRAGERQYPNLYRPHESAQSRGRRSHPLFAQKYGPAITAAGAPVTGIGAGIEVAKAATAALRDSEIAETVAKNVSTAAQWALNAAMAANPIMLIVIGLGLLVAAVILAYTHITVFRNIVDDMGKIAKAAFDLVVHGAEAAFSWISGHWPLLLAILTGPFGLAVYEIATHFDSIVGFAKKIPGDIEHALGDVGNLLVHAGEEIIKGLGRGIENAMGDVLHTVGGIAGKIASLKGPLDYDRQLLVPAGAAIMAGLHDSLAAGIPDVERLMGGVAPNISATISPAPAGAAAAMGRGGPAVVIQDAHFSDDVDVDSFMRRVSWAVGTSRL